MQGSILGPLLFIVFISDIDEEVHCEISKFPDDTKIVFDKVPHKRVIKKMEGYGIQENVLR